MKFGKVENPESVDFTLPPDHPDTQKILNEKGDTSQKPEIFIGCAKWNRQDLKGFYPRGTKDELAYYSTQFNSIELNATFYRPFDAAQFETWAEKTPKNFKFFPKFYQNISHQKWLKEPEEMTQLCINNASALNEKLGMMFLQLRDNFKPKNIDRIEDFLKVLPKGFPVAVEVRNEEWFQEPAASELHELLKKYNATNIIVDTAGRRDMLHFRLTTPYAFVRYVGANIPSDYDRLDDWLEKIENWIQNGIKEIYFFIHQNTEKESPLLAASFIKNLNERFGYDLKIPNEGNGE